jgi:MATE family multidrug resistance protein
MASVESALFEKATVMAIALPGEYNFLSRFYRLASVSVLSNMMVPLAGLVDTAFLGHLADIRHLAGVILASILFDYLYRVLKFLRTSTNAMTAQAAGSDDQTAVLLAGLRSGLIALGIGLLIIALQYPLQKLGFLLLSGAADVEASGVDYFYARIGGAPAVLLNFVLFGWFLGREMNGMVLLMSLVGNGANVVLDYLLILQWGWDSAGAGLATALSQYLALGVGLIGVAATIPWSTLSPALAQVGDRAALRETVVLKGNILIRFLVLISTYAIFTNLSSTLGTTTLAQNGLLLQIALLSQFTIQGVGMTAQTLIGNFKSKGAVKQLTPVLVVALCTTLPIALSFAAIAILWPEGVFGLLTNHTNISTGLTDYTLWLLPLLELTAIAFMLEGYFIGLKASTILRNAVLIAFGVGFLPLAATAWAMQSNHLLWCSLVIYMTVLALVLGSQLPRTLSDLQGGEHKPMPSV